MPLQNRVIPEGNLIATPARGAWLGNRGVLHDEEKRIIRPFKTKAWITCVLSFRDRHRQVMTPNRWTELFFLDEATAFAAGHRPCAECRYADHHRFKTAWLKGNPEYGFGEKTPIRLLDEVLHRQRIDMGRKVTYMAVADTLPNGTFIRLHNEPHLIYNNYLHRWTPFGYDTATSNVEEITRVEVLTPLSIVNTLFAGYQPQVAI